MEAEEGEENSEEEEEEEEGDEDEEEDEEEQEVITRTGALGRFSSVLPVMSSANSSIFC